MTDRIELRGLTVLALCGILPEERVRRQPFTVDLETQRISGPGGPDIRFEIAPADRTRLLEGLDDIGMTLKHSAETAAWEQRTNQERPWLQTAHDSRR